MHFSPGNHEPEVALYSPGKLSFLNDPCKEVPEFDIGEIN